MSLSTYSRIDFDDDNFKLYGYIYNSGSLVKGIRIYSGSLRGYGYGNLNTSYQVKFSGGIYYSLVSHKGSFGFKKYDNLGNLLYSSYNTSFPKILRASEISISALPDSSYMISRLKGIESFTTDTTVGLYVNFLNKEDSLIKKNTVIELSASDEEFDYWDWTGRKIENIVLGDSLYQLIILDEYRNSLSLIRYDKYGNLVDSLSTITIDSNTISKNSMWNGHRCWRVNRNMQDGWYIYSGLNEGYRIYDDSLGYEKYFNRVYEFDENGNYIGIIYQDTLKNSIVGKNTIFQTKEEYVTTLEIKNDIYLKKYESLSLVDSFKINDDIEGSNEHNSGIASHPSSKLFVLYEDENGYLGRMVDTGGIALSDEIALIGKDIKFFDDLTGVNLWKKNESDHIYTGFSIYDSNWTEILRDTLVIHENVDETKIESIILSEDRFVVYTNIDSLYNLFLFDKSGNLVKKRSFSNLISTSIKLVEVHDSTFYVCWGTRAQLFNEQLEPVSEIIKLPASLSIYLGDKEYINTKKMYGEHQMFWYEISRAKIGEDTISNKIYLENYSELNQVLKIKDNQLLVIYNKKGAITAQLYNNNLEELPKRITISSTEGQIKKDAHAHRLENKVLFTWTNRESSESNFDIYGKIYSLDEVTDINSQNKNLPEKFSLSQNYPNPFNPVTTINYEIPNVGQDAVLTSVKLTIYNLLGEEVATIVNEQKPPGRYQVKFDGSNLSSGLYIYRIETDNFTFSRKMLLLK
jgi:hypothetical protein